MPKEKKRKLKQFTSDPDLQRPSDLMRSKKRRAVSDENASRQQDVAPSLSARDQKTHHNKRSDSPDPSSHKSPAQVTTPTEGRVKDVGGGRQQYRSTFVSTPFDPKFTPTFVETVRAQNRRKGIQHPSFTSELPSESDSSPGVAVSIQNSVADEGSNSDQRLDVESFETEPTWMLQTASKPDAVRHATSESDNESMSEIPARSINRRALDNGNDHDSSSSSDADSESDDDKIKSRGPPQFKAAVKPTSENPDLLEERKRKVKARMEEATKTAIHKLQTQAQPSTPNTASAATTTSTTLSNTETQALKSLTALIPANFHTSTLNHLIHDTKRKNKHIAKRERLPAQPSQLHVTLTAARAWILRLSRDLLGDVDNVVSANNTVSVDGRADARNTTRRSEMYMQSELARIARKREQTIFRLGAELERLKSGASSGRKC